MFRVITCNTNGIRAAQRKGFFEWLAKQNADVVCIQETKAQEHQLVDDAFRPDGYHCYYNDAERKGYSGTALYAKQKPSAIEVKVGWSQSTPKGATYGLTSMALVLYLSTSPRAQVMMMHRQEKMSSWSALRLIWRSY